jgi:large subunit ribosomal protein L15
MKLNELADNKGARRTAKRVGRGIGSGKGKTAGSGQKGQKSRSGVSLAGFEGGQMPLYRRLPKRGFTNIFAKEFAEVNIGRLQAAIDAKKVDPKEPIDAAALKAAGVVRRVKDGVRLLGNGEITAKIEIEVAGASKSAVTAVEKAGGKVNIKAAAPRPAQASAEKTPARKTPAAETESEPADAQGDDSVTP